MTAKIGVRIPSWTVGYEAKDPLELPVSADVREAILEDVSGEAVANDPTSAEVVDRRALGLGVDSPHNADPCGCLGCEVADGDERNALRV